MEEDAAEPRAEQSVFVENLRELIGDSSVNAWAKHYDLDQTTIQRYLYGSVPKLPMLELIAEKMGIKPWQLLAPGLCEGLHQLEGKSMIPVTKPTRRPSIGEGGAGKRRTHTSETTSADKMRRRV